MAISIFGKPEGLIDNAWFEMLKINNNNLKNKIKVTTHNNNWNATIECTIATTCTHMHVYV